ncbi:hypothetical protein ACVIM8_007292 [Bradyrhizobium sp. USDA 4529]
MAGRLQRRRPALSRNVRSAGKRRSVSGHRPRRPSETDAGHSRFRDALRVEGAGLADLDDLAGHDLAKRIVAIDQTHRMQRQA